MWSSPGTVASKCPPLTCSCWVSPSPWPPGSVNTRRVKGPSVMVVAGAIPSTFSLNGTLTLKSVTVRAT